jgi:hypothetical protein
MFDSKTKITGRLTDAADLLIDFATLGEYGLEPVGSTRQGCADLAPVPRTRAAYRRSQCSLLEEAGFRGPQRQRA